MKKGTRVEVKYYDITADLHSEKDLDCVVGRVVGWILSDRKPFLKLTTSDYADGCDCKDRISIPQGCVISKEQI
jgi:hypothetical protein